MTWLSEASKAISRVETIGEAKDISDRAAVLKVLAAKQGWSRDEKARIGEIELRATVRIGELLELTPRATGTAGPGRGKPRSPGEHPFSSVQTLENIGLTRKQAHVARAAASVPESDRERFITDAREDGEIPTVRGLVRVARIARLVEKNNATAAAPSAVQSLQELIADGLKFGTIYADPPWQYGNQATRASTDNHYPTMTVDALCEMPVASVAAENSHLHLWTTNGFIFEARRVMEAWGFEYKSCFVWVKPQMGIGNYWRVSHEFMLLGVRGALSFADHSLKSWAEIDRGEHSAKPSAVRRLVERASPGPRLELFARAEYEGWTVLGNQIEATVFAK